MVFARLAILPAALLLCGFVSLERFEHPETGLAIVPPDGFLLVDLLEEYETTAVAAVGVFRTETTDIANPPAPHCVVTLHQRDDNAALTQEQLDTRMRDPAGITALVENFGTGFELTDEAVTLGEIPGHQFTMLPPAADAATPGLAHVVSIFDTPAGRTTVSCQTPEDSLAADLATFGAIRDGVTLP